MWLTDKKEKVQPKNYILPDSKVYTEYELNVKEKIMYFLIAFVCGTLIGYIFYRKVIIAVIAGMASGFIYVPVRRKQIINKQIRTIKIQFKDLLENIATSIGAGKNVVDSFRSAYDDLKDQYTETSYIVIEVGNIVSGMNNNINIENLLLDLAERSGVEDIIIFANVFETCYRKGGNIKEVIKSTHRIINDKMEIEMEIETMVTSAKTEQNMMVVMPVIFMFILDSMGGGISGQGTAASVVSTTVALILFGIAYLVGKKILDIKM